MSDYQTPEEIEAEGDWAQMRHEDAAAEQDWQRKITPLLDILDQHRHASDSFTDHGVEANCSCGMSHVGLRERNQHLVTVLLLEGRLTFRPPYTEGEAPF